MTPKKKAEELVGKYYVTIYHSIHQQKKAKECALITVDEILSVITNSNDYYIMSNYYQQVKQEIEKL